MDYFSEIYGCYYRVVAAVLERAKSGGISREEIVRLTDELGFGESALTIPDKLCFGDWRLLEQGDSGRFYPCVDYAQMPLTLLQKRWIKSILYDRRVSLFLDDGALAEAKKALAGIDPLWKEEQFYYYDRFESGDSFESAVYKENFKAVMSAVRERRVIDFDYTSSKGKYTRKRCLALKLEYSPKNDRFRLIGLRCPFGKKYIIDHYRLDGMANAAVSNLYEDTEITEKAAEASLGALMRQSYDTKPVRLIIEDKRNALERAMLHFANYDKDTKRLEDGTWECCIYYNSSMQTELLIEILSFGPVVKVVSPDGFIALIKERLEKQLALQKLLH